jgi:hypothetical protein
VITTVGGTMSARTREVRSLVGLLAGVLLAVTGCGAGSSPDADAAPTLVSPPPVSGTLGSALADDPTAAADAGGGGTDAATTDGSAEPTGGSAPAGTGDPGRKLTQTQADALLLSGSDVPDGWTTKAAPPPGEVGTTSPARCVKIFTVLTSGSGRTARAATSFTESASGRSLDQTLVSWTKPNAAMAKTLTSTVKACPSFTRTVGGETTPITAKVVPFPALGDRTVALRLTARSGGVTYQLDAVYVIVGHNQLSFVTSGRAAMSRADLETFARGGTGRLGPSGTWST